MRKKITTEIMGESVDVFASISSCSKNACAGVIFSCVCNGISISKNYDVKKVDKSLLNEFVVYVNETMRIIDLVNNNLSVDGFVDVADVKIVGVVNVNR